MLYIGYFRFDFEDPHFGPSEGRFTYALEAADVDEACEMLAAQIPEHHGELLRNTTKLYLDDLVEIAELPAGGILLRADHGPRQDDAPVFIVTLPNNESDSCSSYRQGPDPAHEPEAAEGFEPEPFIEFDEEDWQEAEATFEAGEDDDEDESGDDEEENA